MISNLEKEPIIDVKPRVGSKYLFTNFLITFNLLTKNIT